jgi:hypothetical protein
MALVVMSQITTAGMAVLVVAVIVMVVLVALEIPRQLAHHREIMAAQEKELHH